MEKHDFLKDLNEKQREICLCEGNCLLTACPGSGKTRTITYRLAHIADTYKNSRKWNIAITYTNRAAEEIEKRLSNMNISLENIWTGTIHQFCMSFIIRPYAMYSERLKYGYRIIDEYTADTYGREIAKLLGIECNFYDNPLKYPAVAKEYKKRLIEQKEIDFDQILELSNELLMKNPFIAENVSKIIRSIHVDEFQDTREEQYQILATIVKNNTSINILFVGDANQAIYGGLGGIAKTREELEKLMQTKFREDCLSGCYRSTQRIVDYYSNFEVVPTSAFACSDKIKDDKGIILYNYEIDKENLVDVIVNIISDELALGVAEKEICVIAPQWGFLFHMAGKLKEKMPDVHFDAPEISPFKRDPLNPFYLMAKLIYTLPGVNTPIRKRTATEILSIFSEEYHVYMKNNIDSHDILRLLNGYRNDDLDGIDYYEACVRYTLTHIGIDLECEVNLKTTFDSFLQKTKERIKQYKIGNTNEKIKVCFHEKKGVVLSTIHGVKGEEYTTVIAFALLNGYLPHWDFIKKTEKKPLRKTETQKLLYVLCSRAKKNLYLFSEKGRVTKSGYSYVSTDELKGIQFDYDGL